MSQKNDLILSLNEDTFYSLKNDFDRILDRTLGNMKMKGATDATVTLKLVIQLDKRSMTVGDSIQEFDKPTFKHEISSVMQVKEKATGQFVGEQVMVWDADEERFVLRQFDGGQASMFDEDYETCDEEWGTFADVPDDSKVLPSPAEEEKDEDVDTPFGWLSQFIGEWLNVTESMGNYTVRTKDNKVVLSSATSETNPFYCPANKLSPHVGHKVVCVGYGDDDIVNVSIECEDCNAVLFDIDAPNVVDDAEDMEYENPAEE